MTTPNDALADQALLDQAPDQPQEQVARVLFDKPVHVFVDADLYSFKWTMGILSSMAEAPADSLTFEQRLRRRFETLIQELDEAVGPFMVIWCWSSKLNFRKLINRCYKSNRATGERPKELELAGQLIREWADENLEVTGLEADDIMGIEATRPDTEHQAVICSYDKDLEQVPGIVVYLSEAKRKDRVIVRPTGVYRSTQDRADYLFWSQVITGDTVDGYYGMPGKGPKAAEELWLTLKDMTDAERYAHLQGLYEWHYLNQDYFNRQLWSARILRHGEYEAGRVLLWQPGKPKTLVVDEKETQCELQL